MNVLVACEFSGRVRDSFRDLGHNAWSCDFLPGEGRHKDKHLQCDVFSLPIELGACDLVIAFPPCTYLCSSGLHWNKKRPDRQALTEEAVKFFMNLWNMPVDKVAIENPIGCMSTRFRPPDQIIQPWMFGEDASKATCLWLKNLPKLVPTNILPGGKKARRANQTPSGQNKLGPSKDRAKLRSITYEGIAKAMAEQWGGLT